MPTDDKIYSATYSNVPVYEFNIDGNHVMRRRSDDWINATHILKVADYDKPARTRILEREVQKGVHEKVQGGYGKYQGTWIPLQDGRELATNNNVLEKLLPILDFVPGDRSPPPAPKHATAASAKPRAPRASAASRRTAVPLYGQVPDYDHTNVSMHDGDVADSATVASESVFDDYDASQFTHSRKRRRTEDRMSQADHEHRMWADELLDYFMLQDSPSDSLPAAPVPPANADLNRPIDDKGHTALHWAAAMGDVEVVKDLIRRGARIDVQSKNGETPLMRAVSFVNSFDRQSMEKLSGLLIRTVNMQDWFGGTVFHLIANITERKSKYQCARYYTDCILNKMAEVLSNNSIEQILNEQDQNGDTAITIAARNGARKCIRSLMGRGASVEVPNVHGETADQLIVQLNVRRQERLHSDAHARQISSSPFPSDAHQGAMSIGGVRHTLASDMAGIPIDPLLSRSVHNGNPVAVNGPVEIYRSEAALALTSSIVPVLLDKAKSLATSIDAEIAEKDAELAEAERVAITRRQEIDLLKRQAEELRLKEFEQTDAGPEADDELLRELENLMEECEHLTELEHDGMLHELILQEKERVADDPTGETDLMLEDDEADMHHKLALVQQLYQMTRQRKELIKTIVQRLSVAGISEKQAEYKRLIKGALSVREDDVDSVLPEIAAELEIRQGLDHAGA